MLLHDFAFKGPPYPTSLDLVNDLRAEAPADKQQLITDLFEKITLYDVKATNAVATEARRRALRPHAARSTPRRSTPTARAARPPAPMNETVDVGAFDVEPASPGYDARAR